MLNERGVQGPHDMAVVRHMAPNVMLDDHTKRSLRAKFKRAGWNTTYLATLLALFRSVIALSVPPG